MWSIRASCIRTTICTSQGPRNILSTICAVRGGDGPRFDLKPGALVADIGSNDGTCLRAFREHGLRIVGVDPATEIAQRANESGVETVNAFFSRAVAERLREQYGAAAFITSHNACAHIDQLDDVVGGVAHWLDDDGVFGVEVGYFVDVFTRLQFDTIYHEHLDYHTVAPFRRLLARAGMEALSVQRVAPQGGSIRLIAQKSGGRFAPDGSVEALIALEQSLGLDQPATVAAFADRISRLGEKLRALLASLTGAGKSIAAYGAPTKAVTLLSHFGVGAESLDFVVEDNPMKHGLYLPISAHSRPADRGALPAQTRLRPHPGLEFRRLHHVHAPALRRRRRTLHPAHAGSANCLTR